MGQVVQPLPKFIFFLPRFVTEILILDPDETFINNSIVRKPVYKDEDEERGRIKDIADILDLDFLEIDILERDLLVIDEEETWYTLLDYDPPALEFPFDALEASNKRLAAILKSEFDDIFNETIFGYDPVLNIAITDENPDFVVTRESGTGNYTKTKTYFPEYAYMLNIDLGEGNRILDFKLSVDSATEHSNTIDIFSPGSFANDISITQSGDRLDLDVVQEGQDLTVLKLSRTADIQGDDNTVMVKQRSVVAADSSLPKIGCGWGQQ